MEAAAAFRPDVVLLDIGLPRMNGYEAARKIREQPWGRGMTLVALTVWGQAEDRRKSSEAGFDGHRLRADRDLLNRPYRRNAQPLLPSHRLRAERDLLNRPPPTSPARRRDLRRCPGQPPRMACRLDVRCVRRV